MVSKFHKGMIRNQDGTFSRTPQYDTWSTYNDIQLKDNYECTPKLPEEFQATPYHPEPSRLNLEWSHNGEWVLVPKTREEEGPDYKNYRIGRVERYIDTDGEIRKALSYGDEDTKLKIWYRLDEMFLAFTQWKIPEPSLHYNGRKFSTEIRRPPGSKNTSKAKTKTNSQGQGSGDQSKDIQGKGYQRGGGRGRGAKQYQARGRGVSTARGGGRPSYSDPGWAKDYIEWDKVQTSGPNTHRSQQRWEEDQWSDSRSQRDHREYYRYPDETHQREGYHTSSYESRKRTRSPSPRRYRRRDYSPRYEQGRGRGRSGKDYSSDERDSRRYPSHDR